MLDLHETTDNTIWYFASKPTGEEDSVRNSSQEPQYCEHVFAVTRGGKYRAKSRSLSIAFRNNAFEAEFRSATNLLHDRLCSSRTHSLNRFIASCLAGVEAVERVYSAYRGRVFYTWVVVPERDRETLREIYRRQRQVIDRFPEFEFDFYVLYKKQHSVSDMVSIDIELVFNRSES